MSITNKVLKFGKTSVLPDRPFDPAQAKVRISIMLDGDILQAARAIADKQHIRYQTFINMALRRALLGEKELSGIDSIKRRIVALEQKIARIRPQAQNRPSRKKAA